MSDSSNCMFILRCFTAAPGRSFACQLLPALALVALGAGARTASTAPAPAWPACSPTPSARSGWCSAPAGSTISSFSGPFSCCCWPTANSSSPGSFRSCPSLLPAAVYHALAPRSSISSPWSPWPASSLAAARRLFFPPDYLATSYASPRSGEAFLILGFIAALMLAFFLCTAPKSPWDRRPRAAWMPVSRRLCRPSRRALARAPCMGLAASRLVGACRGAAALSQPAAAQQAHAHPHRHPQLLFSRSLEKPSTQPRENFATGETFGVGSVERFTWKDLLDGFTCTECGRCQDVCPARATGKPLNPRQVVHDIKVNLLDNGHPAARTARGRACRSSARTGEGSNSEEALWACTTCGACLSACPVLIEHMPKIVKMRRHLVEMEASFPEELLNLFENMEQRSNPWGIAPAERSKWSDPARRPLLRRRTDRIPLLRRLRRRLRHPQQARHRRPGHPARRGRDLLGDSRQGRAVLRRQPAPARQRVSSSTAWRRKMSSCCRSAG